MPGCIRCTRWLAPVVVAALAACGGSDSPASPESPEPVVAPPDTTPVTMVLANGHQSAVVGTPFSYDATRSGAAFSDPRKTGLEYTITLAPNSNGLTASGGSISGTPAAPGTVVATVTARDTTGRSASQSFAIVAFSADLGTPLLPGVMYSYSDAAVPIPGHFRGPGPPGGPVIATDNTPPGNEITDAGATLGRVLFYDRRLSVNDRVSCASCHIQEFGFSDTARLSRGFAGGLTGRHSTGLANARYYGRGRFFWDERAVTLEAQALMPIQDGVEMGMTLDALEVKLSLTPYYAPLFEAAFGSREITSARVARALAQFVRALSSTNSRFDQAFVGAGPGVPPNFAGVFTPQELLGQQVFDGPVGGCARCHGTNAQVSDDVHNTGLEATITDAGAGGGRFKAPSLRNIAVRPPFMHDGRFNTLEEVVEFYNSGVQNNPALDPRLRTPGGGVARLNLTAEQKAALVAYLGTLTDATFLSDVRFRDPFGN